jgi:hypothetical protein
MSIFSHPYAIATSKPKAKCANCHHHELIIADLQAWVEELRESRDRWRDLALDTERAAVDAARAEFAATNSSRAA